MIGNLEKQNKNKQIRLLNMYSDLARMSEKLTFESQKKVVIAQ